MFAKLLLNSPSYGREQEVRIDTHQGNAFSSGVDERKAHAPTNAMSS
jgi:hypothetical protein